MAWSFSIRFASSSVVQVSSFVTDADIPTIHAAVQWIALQFIFNSSLAGNALHLQELGIPVKLAV
jgi:hypothetical protein